MEYQDPKQIQSSLRQPFLLLRKMWLLLDNHDLMSNGKQQQQQQKKACDYLYVRGYLRSDAAARVENTWKTKLPV